MHASGLPTKKATVEEALRLLVMRRAQRQALDELWGAGWEGNLDEMRDGRHFNDIK
jgi:Arc/MetJ family transcription regulator